MTRSRAGLRDLLSQFSKRRFHLHSDMYLRMDKVDVVVEPLKDMQENIRLCVNEIRHLTSTALPEHQSTVGQRIAVCEEKIDRLLAAINERSEQATAFSAGTWEDRVQQAQDRKNRLLSFGPYARGLLVKTQRGLFTVDPEDSGVGAILLHEGCYAEPEYLLAKSVVSKEGDVLIVGAHIGALAVPLCRDCNKLVAIEANPHTYKYLKANLALNSCSNVTSYNIAASDKSEKIEFLLNTENSGGSKRRPVVVQTGYIYDDPEAIEIEAMPLDVVLEGSKYDLILMDIEGSEYFALKGMQHILARSKAVSVEFLPHHLAFVSGVRVEDFVGTIIPHFNWMYVPNGDRVIPKNQIVEKIKEMYEVGEEHAGIYFVKEISLLNGWRQADNHDLATAAGD
jgi:FkbM family methyltransferase